MRPPATHVAKAPVGPFGSVARSLGEDSCGCASGIVLSFQSIRVSQISDYDLASLSDAAHSSTVMTVAERGNRLFISSLCRVGLGSAQASERIVML